MRLAHCNVLSLAEEDSTSPGGPNLDVYTTQVVFAPKITSIDAFDLAVLPRLQNRRESDLS